MSNEEVKLLFHFDIRHSFFDIRYSFLR